MTVRKQAQEIVRLLIICPLLFQMSCDSFENERETGSGNPSAPDRSVVVTSNYPLYFLSRQIVQGVDAAPDIVLPDIEGDPVHWVPSTDQIQRLQTADLIILNGASAEPWLNWISLTQRKIVNTTAALSDRLITQDQSVRHQHGPTGDHSHNPTAFTTWLDPTLLTQQARAIEHALTALTPEHATQYRRNMSALAQSLAGLDQELSKVFAQLNDRPVLFSHPVYQYLQRRYKINGESVHWEPETEPSTTAWIDLQDKLVRHPATIMIWEEEPLPATRKRLHDKGIATVAFHTVSNRPPEGDFLSAMRLNTQALGATLEMSAAE